MHLMGGWAPAPQMQPRQRAAPAAPPGLRPSTPHPQGALPLTLPTQV